jgi:hypothetical protein
MMMTENRNAPPESPEPAAPSPGEQAQYLRWVAERVRSDGFWTAVKEDILEDFASLLNRELPEDLWRAAYAQRDGKDYLIAFQAVLERIEEYCKRIADRVRDADVPR